MTTTGQKVRLTGKTRHGKNRVREQGTTHTVKGVQEGPVWHTFRTKKGTWLLLQSDHDGSRRWVHATDDDNFDVSEVHDA